MNDFIRSSPIQSFIAIFLCCLVVVTTAVLIELSKEYKIKLHEKYYTATLLLVVVTVLSLLLYSVYGFWMYQYAAASAFIIALFCGVAGLLCDDKDK